MPAGTVLSTSKVFASLTLHGLQESKDVLAPLFAQEVLPGRHPFVDSPDRDRRVRGLTHPDAVAERQPAQVASRLGAHGVGRVAVRAMLVEQAAAETNEAVSRGGRRARAGLGWPHHAALTVDVDRSSEGKAVLVRERVDLRLELVEGPVEIGLE